MKKIKVIVLSGVVMATLISASGISCNTSSCQKTQETVVEEFQPNQTVNMFVTHGHCSLPFAGVVEELRVEQSVRDNGGNPLENMKLTFVIDPSSFFACRGEDLTERVKTPGLFIGEKDEKMTFTSTSVYTMGLDWYQVNGMLSIKGVEREVKFFASGIRDPKESFTTRLIIEGQLDLTNWGIDYDKIVNGDSDVHPTKWLHMNMQVDLC